MLRTGLAASNSRRPLLLAPLLVLGLSLLSCGREITGPEGGIRQAAFALAPAFPSAFAVEGSGSVVPFTKVRVTLHRLDNTLVLAEVRDFPADQQSIELDLTVDLPFGTTDGGIELLLNMQYIDAAGDTVFRAGPQTVTATPSEDGEPAPTVVVEVEYVGTGSNAAFMDLSPANGTVVSGTTTQFSATAYDATETEIPNTPFIFSSPDVTKVTITPQGHATWLPVRGTARIIATLPTGELADTTVFTVTLPPTQLQVVSGNGQSALAGETLEEPVVLRVAASDGVPVAGVQVSFSVSSDGGTVNPVSAVSDANGLVSFEWTMGNLMGVYTTTAIFTGLPAPVAVTATVGQSPAVDLEYTSGDEQSGAPGQPLADAIVVRAIDAQGNGVPGVVVTFTANLGGGSFAPNPVITNVSGHAATFWTLGSSPGTQGAQAEVAGIQTVIGFTANAVAAGGSAVLWTGAVSFDWSVAGNWSTGVVPSATDSVVIPAVATQPRLTAATTVGAVNVSAGTLWLNGQTLTVMRDFATTGSGVLVMQEAGSTMAVLGDVLFAGGNESGLLTEGGISVLGDFRQTGTNSTASFQAADELIVSLASASPTVSFENPGRGLNDSRFAFLGWIGGGTLTQESGITISNAYIISTSAPATQVGIGGTQGRYLEFAAFGSTGDVTFDNVRLIVTQPSTDAQAFTINNVTLRNLPTTAIQLTVTAPSGAIILDNVDFQVTPTTGLYISATDNNGSDDAPLSVEVANATPTTPGPFTAVAGGATIAWPVGSTRAWIGTVSTDWMNANNWAPAGVPGALDLVTIFPSPGAPNQPTLATARTIGGLQVLAGATLTIPAGGQLTVTGDLASDGTVLVDELSAALFATGTGRSVRGSFENLAVNGVYLLNGTLDVSNDIIVRGSLNANGFTLNTTDLIMVSAGVLVMQDPNATVTVTGQAMFTGGTTAGLLTDGILRVGGRLVSNTSGTGNPPNSFTPTGGHTVQLFGTGTIDIDILNLGGVGNNTSYIRNLDISQHSGTVNFVRANNNYVSGRLISHPSGAPPTLASNTTVTLQVAGVSVSGLVVDDVSIVIGEGLLQQFDNVRFTGFPPLSGPLTIANAGNGGPFTMNGLIFETVPSGTGARYLLANDADGPTGPNPLVINVNNADPASPGGFIAAVNGAVINWPMSAPIRLWTGASNGTWSNAANWTGGIVPAATDSARIPAGVTNFPTLDNNVTLAGLAIEDGASLNLDVHGLTMTGDLHVPLTPSVSAVGLLQVTLAAPGAATVSGTLPGTEITGGTWAPTAPAAFGSLLISAGSLAVGSSAVTINGSLTTASTGTLGMVGPANVVVTGDATFGGGNTEDLLTGGTLMIAGNFAQSGDTRSFNAGPGHTVELTGNLTQVVNFLNPDLALNTACAASCFGTLRSIRLDGSGDVAFTNGAKAVTLMEIDAENIFAGTTTLLSGGTPTLTASETIQAHAIGFVSGITQTSTTFAVDSLIGFGNGFTLTPNLTTPTRLAGSYAISGPHSAGLVVTQGALDVAGVATINGPLVLNANGWLRMTDATDTLGVSGNFTVSGNSPINQLTAGTLAVNGSFFQTAPGIASFNAEPAHRTKFTGPGRSVQFLGASINRFGTVEFAGSSTQIISDARVTGDVIALSTAGPVTSSLGTGVFVNGGLYDTLGTNWRPELTIFEGADPVLPTTVRGAVRFRQLTNMLDDKNFMAALEVDGPGELVLNGNRISVIGPFVTMNGGRLRMTTPADTLSLSGPATFAGGAGVMSAGVLELHGDFIQGGVANSFAPSGTHQTWFYGLADQSVTFNSPGAGAGASHFNDFGVAMGTEGMAVVLQSDVWANGRFMTVPAAARRLRATVRRVLHSAGADVQSDVEFDNVGWALVDGASAAPINGLRFVNMVPTLTQLSIQRSSGPLVFSGLLDFQTAAAAPGFYMRVEDPNGATDGTLDVQLSGGVSPGSHGGFLDLVAPATVTTWPGTPEFNWVGTTSGDWSTASNWSGGTVPGAADSVFVPAGTPNAPQVDVGSEIRTLALAPGAMLNLGAELVVHGSVDVAPAAAITATLGRLELSNEAGGTISGAMPQLRVLGGLFTLDGNVSITGNVEIAGNEFTPGIPVEGNVSIGNFTLTSTGGLLVNQQGAFTMTGIGTADFATYANFFGNSTAGRLTSGTLRIGTEFFQDGTDSPSSFQASGTHVTEFAGTAPEPRIVFDTPDLTPNATCAASCFATLRSIKAPGQGGLRFESGAKILGTLQLQADSVSAPGFAIMAAGSPTFDTPILRAGAIGHEGTITQNASTLQVDSLVAWGVGQVLGSIPGVRTVVTGSYTLDNVAFPSLLEVDGSVAIANNVSIASNLHVDGTVSLTAGDTPALLTVNGNLFVRGPSSALISSGQPHVIDVTGSATFSGGNSTGNLAIGRLRVASNFSALATESPMSFVADPAYVVEFTGPGTIGISNPALSTFGAIDFSNTGFSRTLNTDIRATGLVSLSASSFTMISGSGPGAGGTRRIFADRVDANGTGFSMFNVAITTRAFNSGVSGSINFNNFDPTVIQLEITEGGSLGSLLRNATFATVPTGAGRYVRVTDATPGGTDGSPALVVQTPSPIFHGGAAEAIAPATMTGWAAAPNFRWTGAVDNAWTQPGNWADNIVPGPTDSVYFTDGYTNPPSFPGQVTLRAFVTDVTSFLNMSGELTVTERLVTNSNMDCDGGEVILAGGVSPVLFAGDISCGSVRISSGTAVPDGRVTVGSDLMVWGVDGPAELVLNRNTVVAPFFHTIAQGRLRMTEATDSLITQAATFVGASTNGQLTDGVLVITGNFTQDAESSAESFAASGNHTTVFAGTVNQQSFFATPGEGAGTSHFANVEMSKGEVGTHLQLNSRTFALGALRTGSGAPAQRLLANLTEPTSESVLFQSHGADVDLMSFSNVKWSILDGAAIGRMDNITFFAIDSASTQLNIERAGGATVGIRNIVFGPLPQEGRFIRLVDLDGGTGGTFTVNLDGVTPSLRNEAFITLVNGAVLTGWPIG